MTVWSVLNHAPVPWGDYGSILVGGMTERRDPDGRLPLSRTGPFVPPITVAFSDLLVTDDFRTRMEESSLAGFTFAEVRKKRIVKLAWRSWDLDAPDPQRWPAGGEPEQYIEGRKHNEAISETMGPIWEVVIDGLLDDAADGVDFVRTEVPYAILVSGPAREWLTAEAGDWLVFADYG